MTRGNDPFRYLPELRDKIANPMTSDLRDFDLAVLDEKMRQAGAPENWRHNDTHREASRRNTLHGRGDSDLWVFAYVSLIWDPAFLFSEVRTGLLKGYHRAFCLTSVLGRGTSENPGLMAGLDMGGDCVGIVFRIDRDQIEHETRVIWRREMLLHAYVPTFVHVETPLGNVEALAFVVDHAAESYRSGLSEEETARHLASAVGFIGSGLAYIENLVEHLEAVGIVDRPLVRLRDLARRMAAQ